MVSFATSCFLCHLDKGTDGLDSMGFGQRTMKWWYWLRKHICEAVGFRTVYAGVRL